MKKPVAVALTRCVFMHTARQAAVNSIYPVLHHSVLGASAQMASNMGLVGLDTELGVTVEEELLGILGGLHHEKT